MLNSFKGHKTFIKRGFGRSLVCSRGNHFNGAHLAKCAANYAPLTPLTTFERAVSLYPSKPAYVYEETTRTWGEVGARTARLASALQKLGVERGDTVSVMAPNIPAMYEAHFGVPGAGAVLHTINTRLDPFHIAYQLNHCEAKVVIVDAEFKGLLAEVKDLLLNELAPEKELPLFISVKDPHMLPNKECTAPDVGPMEYEELLETGNPEFAFLPCLDEWDAISVNYTSGTTGNPKGVVFHYRGAYLNSMANLLEWEMEKFAKFLWVVPMFHCNGWMFPWSIAATVGCSFLMRYVRASTMFDLMHTHKIGYLAGAPITMSTMLSHPDRKKFKHPVKMWTAGAPPPPSVLKQFSDELGIHTQTAYGLTETYGPISSHLPDPEWKDKLNLSDDEILKRCTLQSHDVVCHGMTVRDPVTMEEVPADGETMGEVMIRGNSVMKGYLKNPSATEESFAGGWFRSGDLGVNHGNGRLELKDRSKDIIISGGENISSIEVENILMTHPDILEVAVLAMPDEKWGEIPCAFIALNPSITAAAVPSEKELVAWSREHMAHFMAPKRFIVTELPKTSTGKIQKNLLRTMLPE